MDTIPGPSVWIPFAVQVAVVLKALRRTLEAKVFEHEVAAPWYDAALFWIANFVVFALAVLFAGAGALGGTAATRVIVWV